MLNLVRGSWSYLSSSSSWCLFLCLLSLLEFKDFRDLDELNKVCLLNDSLLIDLLTLLKEVGLTLGTKTLVFYSVGRESSSKSLNFWASVQYFLRSSCY